MKKIALLILLFPAFALAQTPSDLCSNAPILSNYCSATKYTNVGSAATFVNQGPDVWVKFVPSAFDATITVTGGGAGGMRSPSIGLYTDCSGNMKIGTTISENNITTFHVGGLIIGNPYWIQIESSAANAGTFTICVDNFNPVAQAGQDFNTASVLCSKDPFSLQSVRGAGLLNDEARNTCLGQPGSASEKNSAWYRWTAATSGSLTFTITPLIPTNDIDWVLFDLGAGNTDATTISSATVMRCAAGSGIDCPSPYYITGMNMTSNDITEQSGCVPGQDGWVRFVDMQAGHSYALLINNFTDPVGTNLNANNGFKIEFGGTGEFVGPKAAIDFTVNRPCTVGQNFTFRSLSTNATGLRWTLNQDASIQSRTDAGPFTVSYATPGTKTVVLEAVSANGCTTVAVKTFEVGVTPDVPIITANKNAFCIGDTLVLSTRPLDFNKYFWTGPDNFKSEEASIKIPLTGASAGGTYTLVAKQGDCASNPATYVVPAVLSRPVAAFRTVPTLPAKLSVPVTIRFFNQSTNADSYHWDFGDGATSTEANPEHEYTTTGSYDITLVAFKSNVCSFSVTKGTFVITADNAIFIPNTFTPNGDNINDEFVVTISNLQSYKIRIYNRWGTPVFESINIFENWKGLYRGEPLPAGVYYYAIEALSLNNTNIKRSGSITIIR